MNKTHSKLLMASNTCMCVKSSVGYLFPINIIIIKCFHFAGQINRLEKDKKKGWYEK